jgi:IS5 family transposase
MPLSFGDAEDLGGRTRTRRAVFLAERDQVVPWKALRGLIEPHDPTLGRPGRQP